MRSGYGAHAQPPLSHRHHHRRADVVLGRPDRRPPDRRSPAAVASSSSVSASRLSRWIRSFIVSPPSAVTLSRRRSSAYRLPRRAPRPDGWSRRRRRPRDVGVRAGPAVHDLEQVQLLGQRHRHDLPGSGWARRTPGTWRPSGPRAAGSSASAPCKPELLSQPEGTSVGHRPSARRVPAARGLRRAAVIEVDRRDQVAGPGQLQRPRPVPAPTSSTGPRSSRPAGARTTGPRHSCRTRGRARSPR